MSAEQAPWSDGIDAAFVRALFRGTPFAIVTVKLGKGNTVIDTTVGIESVTWYQTDPIDRRRIQVTFQDELRKDFIGGERLPGEIELFGDDRTYPVGRMSVDSPEVLDQLARAITVAAQHWRHCIEECDCFKSELPAEEDEGMKIISFGGMNFEDLYFEDLYGQREDEDEDPEG